MAKHIKVLSPPGTHYSALPELNAVTAF